MKVCAAPHLFQSCFAKTANTFLAEARTSTSNEHHNGTVVAAVGVIPFSYLRIYHAQVGSRNR